jgi:predicted transcriptional regulator
MRFGEDMKTVASPLPCELAVRIVIPSLRALVARELTQKYSMRQEEAALALGVTQSAISQYVRSARGNTLNLEGISSIHEIIGYAAGQIASNGASAGQINALYCKACRVVREEKLLCEVHKRFDPDYDVKNCRVCMSSSRDC